MPVPAGVPQGLLNLPDLNDLTNLLPGPIKDAIKDTVGKILDPNDDSVSVGDPQPEGEKPIPTETPKQLSGAIKALDGALGAIDLIQKFGFLIPDEFEDGLNKLEGALRTIRNWLD